MAEMAEKKRKINWTDEEREILIEECTGETGRKMNKKFSTEISVRDKANFWVQTAERYRSMETPNSTFHRITTELHFSPNYNRTTH